MRPLRILGAASAGFGLAAEALYNSAERRKNHSHTLLRFVKIGKGQARTPVRKRSPRFLRDHTLKFRKHFGTCARNATIEILGAVSAGFGLAAEALYNSAERRKNHSHTPLRFVEIGLSQARTQCA